MEFGVTKVFPHARSAETEDPERVVLQSKKDRLFRASTGNPSSFPRLVLTEGKP